MTAAASSFTQVESAIRVHRPAMIRDVEEMPWEVSTPRPLPRLAEVRPPRVLVAEDDPHMRTLLVDTLREEGYQVIEVTNGLQLQRCLRNRSVSPRPDLILSDIRMPGKTGLDVLGTLRESDWLMPVILITAFPDDETKQAARRLGAAALLSKPFDIDDMLYAVRSIVPLRG